MLVGIARGTLCWGLIDEDRLRLSLFIGKCANAYEAKSE